MITVLIADDSFLMRTLIGDILSTDPEIRVVGAVSDGEQVIEAAKKLKPDVITMDLEMPKMNGMLATERILSEVGPRPIVLMVSAFDKDRADSLLDCLRAGAFDCVVKPSGSLSLDMNKVKAELIAKVRAAASSRTVALQGDANQPSQQHDHGTTFPLVLIGASTGGPPVLEQLFRGLAGPLPAAVLVVQHMPEKFTASMAERIDQVSRMKVKEAQEGERIKPGVALIAPGNHHLVLRKAAEPGAWTVHLTSDPPVHGLRPSIDVLMQSACKIYTGPLLGVLLTGMGADGADGMRDIHRQNGRTIVQDPETCVVDSMVRHALERTTIDQMLSPAAIAHALETLTRS